MAKFYTELPQDEYGNRGYTNSQAQVIEAEPRQDQYGNEHLTILAPATFISRWTSVMAWGWIEVDGPARFLSEHEYCDLLERFGASEEYLLAARRRMG